MMADRRTLVIGGTRGTGLLIVQRLLDANHEVRVLARNPQAARRNVPDQAQIVRGDLAEHASLLPAVEGMQAIVFTAGVPSGTCATEQTVRRIDYEGVLKVLAAARHNGFAGRFLYLNSIGIGLPSPAGWLIDTMKRNTFAWRRQAEARIRASGLDYTIIRVGFLVDRPGGRREVALSQHARPLSLRTRIARADVADCFVAALDHARASRSTFEIVWGEETRRESWTEKFERVRMDAPDAEQSAQ